jgi:uncharacterized protein (DUF983 family)
MAKSTIPNKFVAMLRAKCPRCRKGNMYTTNSAFPLRTMLSMPDHCEVCGQKYELETGFYFGTGYVSYALSVAFIAAWFVAYGLLIGLSFKNNSIFWALGSGIFAIVCIQPWLMRLSRSLYLRMFVRYDEETKDL